METSPIQPASTGRRLRIVAGMVVLYTLGILWVVSRGADVRGVPFGEAMMPQALRYAGTVVILCVAAWVVSRTGAATGRKTASPEERAAWAAAHTPRWRFTGLAIFAVTSFIWGALADPGRTLPLAEAALRVAPFAAWTLLASAGLDVAVRAFAKRTGHSTSAPFDSPGRALAAGVTFAVYMPVVFLPIAVVSSVVDASGDAGDAVAHGLRLHAQITAGMLPYWFMCAGLMALAFWGSPRIDAWVARRRRPASV